MSTIPEKITNGEEIKNIEIGEYQELAEQHVEDGRVSQVKTVEQQCIDGRTLQTDLVNNEGSKEVILRPGGAAGWSLILLAMGYSEDTSYKAVLAFLQSKGIDMRYGWHTDAHSMHDNTEDNVAKQTKTHRGICLQGDHNEQFILRVMNDRGWSVLPLLQDNRSAFVYDVAADTTLLEKFVTWFNVNYPNERPLDLNTVIETRSAQDMMTLRLLAAGKEIYDVVFDSEGNPTVTFAGKVGTLNEEEQRVVTDRKSEKGTTGCGHFERAVRFFEWYGVDQEKARALYRRIQQETNG